MPKSRPAMREQQRAAVNKGKYGLKIVYFFLKEFIYNKSRVRLEGRGCLEARRNKERKVLVLFYIIFKENKRQGEGEGEGGGGGPPCKKRERDEGRKEEGLKYYENEK